MDTVLGQDNIFLFRFLGETGNAWKLAFQTDGTASETRDFSSDPTKDGNVSSPGAYEATYSLTSYLQKGDTYVNELKQAVRNPRSIEVWNIDTTDSDEETTLNGDYAVCDLTSVETTAGAEGNVEVSTELQVKGTPVAGQVDVTPELLAIIRRIEEEREFVQPIETDNGGGGVEG